jgi:hypothetical protein
LGRLRVRCRYRSSRSRGGERNAVAFMGQLKTPSGRERLVAVEFFPRGSLAHYSAAFVYVIEPGQTPIRQGRLLQKSAIQWSWGDLLPAISLIWRPSALSKPENVCIYAGQVDPANRSRFTIRYRARSLENVIEGRIDDEDRVTLTAWGFNWPATAPTRPQH